MRTRAFLFNLVFCASLISCATVPREPGGEARMPAEAPPRTELWRVVREQCLENPAPVTTGTNPCLLTDPKRGFILFRDAKSPLHDLIVPSRPVTGIEDPQILAPDAPNYFALAWNGFADIEHTAGQPVPRDLLGAAINPIFQRSQDQLHIHIACLWPDIAQALREHLGEFTDWEHSRVILRGREYRVMALHQAQLGDTNPFHLLANDLKPGDQPLANHTLILTGARFADGSEGFLLLDRSGPPSDPKAVHGEDLQDNSCAVLKPN